MAIQSAHVRRLDHGRLGGCLCSLLGTLDWLECSLDTLCVARVVHMTGR